MGKRGNLKKTAVCLAALCLVLCLSACSAGDVMDAVFSRFSPVGPGVGEAAADPLQTDLPEDANSREGIVLDASDGLLILRTVEGTEHVFRLEGAEDLVEGGTAAGQFVRVWYSGELEGTNARNVKLLRVEAAQETQPDTYDQGCVLEGHVVSFNEWRITLRTAGGREYRFMAGESVRALQRELTEGMWLRVTFDGTPETPVISRVTESTRAADVYTVTGTLRAFDEEGGTVTLQADSGGTYTFRLGDAEIIAPRGLWADKRRFVLSYRGSATPESAENALLLRMCAADSADPQILQGVICDVDTDRGQISACTANGRVLTFSPGAEVLDEENGVVPGNGISITYEGCISGTTLHEINIISMEMRAAAAETEILGTVRALGADTLRLDAFDGRTLVFRLPKDRQFPERMAVGDTVRVRCTGWIEGEDTSHAVYESAVRAYD